MTERPSGSPAGARLQILVPNLCPQGGLSMDPISHKTRSDQVVSKREGMWSRSFESHALRHGLI